MFMTLIRFRIQIWIWIRIQFFRFESRIRIHIKRNWILSTVFGIDYIKVLLVLECSPTWSVFLSVNSPLRRTFIPRRLDQPQTSQFLFISQFSILNFSPVLSANIFVFVFLLTHFCFVCIRTFVHLLHNVTYSFSAVR